MTWIKRTVTSEKFAVTPEISRIFDKHACWTSLIADLGADDQPHPADPLNRQYALRKGRSGILVALYLGGSLGLLKR